MEEIRLTVDNTGERLDVWLAGKIEGYSRTYLQKLIREGYILVNNTNARPNYLVRAGDNISVTIPESSKLEVKPESLEFDIIYEDKDILVINKPKGMVVHPAAGNYSGTLVNALMKYCGENLSSINGVLRPGIVHRLDKDTSGLLLVAKNNVTHLKLSEKLKNHQIKRVYEALVEGVIKEDSGKIDAPIGRHPFHRKKMAVNTRSGRNAVTHFRVLERFKDSTYIELKLETGRTHQIRVHMAFIKHPVLGDTLYGSGKKRNDLKGQVLHARKIGFEHPSTGEYMEFESPLPEYFIKLLKDFRNESRH